MLPTGRRSCELRIGGVASLFGECVFNGFVLGELSPFFDEFVVEVLQALFVGSALVRLHRPVVSVEGLGGAPEDGRAATVALFGRGGGESGHAHWEDVRDLELACALQRLAVARRGEVCLSEDERGVAEAVENQR